MKADLAFRLALAGGLLPVLLLGFLSSVLADRLVFLGWGVLTAGIYGWVLRRTFHGTRRRIAPAAVLAAGVATYAALAARYAEDLSLGIAAALPPAALGPS